MVKKLHIKEAVEIEVKNTGVLEVPEDKNVDELPIKHFVALAKKKGLSKVTKALNNLQVWNKNKDPKLSKWAGDMIDKVTKRVENQKNESIRRTYVKESNQDKIDYRLECADYAMYKVVTNHTGIELISDNTNGKYEVDYNGVTVTVEFDLDGIAKYEYTINGEGPYCHDSYEYITNDIRNYVDEILDNEDDIDESCTLTEFSSNFDGTEFDEVEFYSKDLSDYPEYQIKSAIEAGCTFPINIYDVTYEWGGNIVISYEVKEEDYNPDNIEQEIIAVLERLENRIRG